ncbi:GntR family transcriptional regulator [Spirochaetia bacterium 38H-sp]|uniref:GntR family transcriptional regulator n=1 Tax=Rarispira pelagica TaxID=3141764 RepID=A0ABU9UAC6_9SPIR
MESLSVPKYVQIKNNLIKIIEEDGLKEGDILPSETFLATSYGVSRVTVRQAIDLLVREGLVYKIQGKGTFYRGKPKKSKDARTHLIGVISPITRWYIYPHILDGIEQKVQEYKYGVMIGNSRGDVDKEYAIIQDMIRKGVEGILLEPAASSFFMTRQARTLLPSLKIPVVLIDSFYEEARSYLSMISPDDVEGGKRAADYLVKMGHKKIGILYKRDVMAGRLRYLAFKQRLEELGCPLDPSCVWTFSSDEGVNDVEPTKRLVRKFLMMDSRVRPTAMFFFNDETALHGFQMIRAAGLSVPDDVSILSYDDSEFARFCEVPLTSISHPKEELGRRAVEVLVGIIEGDIMPPQQILFAPHIVERHSVICRS